MGQTPKLRKPKKLNEKSSQPKRPVRVASTKDKIVHQEANDSRIKIQPGKFKILSFKKYHLYD